MSTKFSDFTLKTTSPGTDFLAMYDVAGNARITKTNFLKELQDEVDTNTGDISDLDTDKLAIASIDDTPANDADTCVSSKWVYDNIYNKFLITSVAKNADYTITDIDGFKAILVTAGSTADVTITLPTAADNTDREIVITKVDSGSKNVVIDGEGAETINGFATIALRTQYDRLTIKCNGTLWIVLESRITFDTGWVSLADWSDATIDITHGIGVHLPYLEQELFWSASGVDGADNKNILNLSVIDVVGYGQSIVGKDTTSVTFQTGVTNGLYLLNTGVWDIISAGYYRVILKRKL